VSAFLDRAGPALTTDQVGQAVADLAAGRVKADGAYLLTAGGLRPAP
jgi:hypothetical protein